MLAKMRTNEAGGPSDKTVHEFISILRSTE
jgi:hypothetical protein